VLLQRQRFGPRLKLAPVADAAIPKTPQHRSEPTRFATLDNVLDMIDFLPDTAATVVAVAAFAGLRKSEIQGLKWEDLRNGELYIERSAWRPTQVVQQTKTEASKAAVPVIPELAKHLEAHRNGFGHMYTSSSVVSPRCAI
jgi:integrase